MISTRQISVKALIFMKLVSLRRYMNAYRTYVIGHYNPSVRIIDFIHKWRDIQFKVDSERQIFEKLFMAIFYLLAEFLEEIC